MSNHVSLDLNLLRTLVAAIEERSTVGEPRRLFVSQPTVSGALGLRPMMRAAKWPGLMTQAGDQLVILGIRAAAVAICRRALTASSSSRSLV